MDMYLKRVTRAAVASIVVGIGLIVLAAVLTFLSYDEATGEYRLWFGLPLFGIAFIILGIVRYVKREEQAKKDRNAAALLKNEQTKK